MKPNILSQQHKLNSPITSEMSEKIQHKAYFFASIRFQTTGYPNATVLRSRSLIWHIAWVHHARTVVPHASAIGHISSTQTPRKSVIDLLPPWRPALCEREQAQGPIFESYDEFTKNLWKILTYEKLRMSVWLSKKSYEKLKDEFMQNLWKTYDDITGILRKRKISRQVVSFGKPSLRGCYRSNILS